MTRLTLRRPDDWHVHFRSDAMLRAVVPYTASVMGRAIVMPNTVPPVTDAALAAAYMAEIRGAVPRGAGFTPLMMIYLTDETDPDNLAAGFRDGVVFGAKLYPAHATTNSAAGVTDIERIAPVLDRMAEIGMPLSVHGEVTDEQVDIFDREEAFIDRVLDPLRRRHPDLKVVMEHITTRQAVEYVRAANGRIGATITVQHLMLTRNDMLVGGIRPHLYCLPILKRDSHRAALRAAATRGEPWFFLGTDTAPHPRSAKESACGCAGVFSAPVALGCYATVFEEEDALHHLEAFASENGPRFHGLPPNAGTVTLVREDEAVPGAIPVEGSEDVLVPFAAGETVRWRVESVSMDD